LERNLQLVQQLNNQDLFKTKTPVAHSGNCYLRKCTALSTSGVTNGRTYMNPKLSSLLDNEAEK